MHQGLVSLLRILFRWGLLQQKALPAAAIYPELCSGAEIWRFDPVEYPAAESGLLLGVLRNGGRAGFGLAGRAGQLALSGSARSAGALMASGSSPTVML